MLTITGLSKQYAGGVSALRDVELRLEHGAFVSLLGPSGCGKSTLLRIVAGLIPPSSGRITWDEIPARGGIGVVFQEPTLMPWLSACKNAEVPLRIAGVAAEERRARAMQMLARVGLEGFAGAYPRTLSGGMKMRVAIARALVTRPPLLLLDEPFAALDELTRQHLNDDLLAICAAEKLTVLFVTHSAAEAVYLSGRVLLMGPRPGTITDEIRINAPEMRHEGFRHSAPFAAHCSEISARMRRAAMPEAAA